MGSAADQDNEIRDLRARLESIEELLRLIETEDLSGGKAFAAKTITLATYPTTGGIGRTYAIKFQDVTGPETEGGVATITDRPGNHFAVNLGAGLPPSGTEILVYEVPYAYVFRFA